MSEDHDKSTEKDELETEDNDVEAHQLGGRTRSATSHGGKDSEREQLGGDATAENEVSARGRQTRARSAGPWSFSAARARARARPAAPRPPRAGRRRVPRAPPPPSRRPQRRPRLRARARARRAEPSRARAIAAWPAKRPSSSISCSEKRDVLRPVEHLQDAEHLLVVEQRHGHHPLRHVPGPLGDVAGEARILLDVVEHERRARREHPAGDPGRRRQPRPDEVLLVLAGDGGEDELVRLLVEEEDRRRLRREDRARHLDDRAQQRARTAPRRRARRRQPPPRSRRRVIVATSYVGGRQVQHGLQLERRQAGMLAQNERRDPGDARRREAVAGRP